MEEPSLPLEIVRASLVRVMGDLKEYDKGFVVNISRLLRKYRGMQESSK
jgi:hypothetical protein